ncbi:MAG: hypothetical protein PF518_19035, partial [Spirochaetaceae bacterium]|nr:hypothetical protein [Spirochaetaceae bacterium]
MKKTKIPKIFTKQYSPKALNKKILKRIHIPKDRKMISDLFVENDKGKMVLKEDLPQDISAKLKGLSKSIKKNKGLVTKWKAVFVLILISLILIFNFFFKDQLIKKAAESGLEYVFQGDVDLVKPHLSLFKGSITYESLTIT